MSRKLVTPEEAASALMQGRAAGLDFFFHEYYAALNWFALKMVHDAAIAEDVIADCFVKLWNNRANLQKPGSVKAYLYATVRHACIDHIRHSKIVSDWKSQLQQGLTSPEDISARIIEAETWRQIHVALNKLPPRSRQVFVMYYLQEMSYQEIAQAMGISIHTVRNQKVRAVELMRKHLPPHLLALLLSFSMDQLVH